MAVRALIRGRHPRLGMTMIETTAALAICGLTLLHLSESLTRSGSALTVSQRRAALMLESQRALDEAAGRLKDAVAASLLPDPIGNLGSDDLRFSRLAGFVDGAPVWGNQERLFLRLCAEELLDGEDQDGDGLIDEHELILVRSLPGGLQRERVLASEMPPLGAGEAANGADDDGDGLIDEPSFVVQRNGEVLSVSLSIWMPVQEQGLEQVQVVENTRQVALRN
jgi:hypothetical protein